MFQTNLLWQNDDRWASHILGTGPQTIKEWGCLMTDLTMVVNGFGYNETPKTFNDKMLANGGYQGAFINAFRVPSIFPGVQTLSYDDCEHSPAPITKIDAALAAGNPVIIQIDRSPNPGLQSHWVVAYAREGNDYLVYDPYRYSGDAPGKKLSLLSRYGRDGADLATAITGALFMAGTKGPKESLQTTTTSGTTATFTETAPAEKVPVPADSILVYASTDDLAFRSGPSVGTGLLGRVSMNTGFKTLEKKYNVDAKLGRYNQWLHVQDPTGRQGYVAAWYISKDKTTQTTTTSPAPVATAPPSAGSSLSGEFLVTPTTGGLAMRSQPNLSGALIKRLAFSSKLKVLESITGARPKVGVVNKWLQVQDITGQKGYVAAWYVTEAAAPALGVKAQTEDDEGGIPDTQEGIIVRTLVDQVAFRSQPQISSNTLLGRLPLRAELVLLDPNEAQKIGKIGQWARVRDINGKEGFVAAWYVTR